MLSAAMQTILAIDIGNTSITLGLYRNGKVSRIRRVTPGRSLGKLLRDYVGTRSIAGTGMSSVVPSVNAAWEKAAATLGEGPVIQLSHHSEIGIPIDYPKPASIGADRLANACAASHLFGAPVVVADFGTALTFDIIDRKKGYVGGVIAPGIPLMFEYLSDKTALLPRIEPKPVNHAVGRSTEEAMRIGGQIGYRGIVRELLTEIKKELGVRRLSVCATGGYAGMVVKDLDQDIPVVEDLTLLGIGRIYELNT
jgi:type III pantothenate kinase